MNLTITSDVFDLFPELLVGVVVLHDVVNASDLDFQPRLEQAQAELRNQLGAGAVTEHPRVACWREAYRKFGAKPKKYPSSIENLARRTLKGESLRSIHPLVDIYNITSLEHFIPMGGEDLAAVRGDIRLARAGENEPAVRLLGESEARPPKPGEVFYTDDDGAICRRWNWKEAERTKLTPETKQAVLVAEALPPIGRDALESAVDALVDATTDVVGGTVFRTVLDVTRPSWPLP